MSEEQENSTLSNQLQVLDYYKLRNMGIIPSPRSQIDESENPASENTNTDTDLSPRQSKGGKGSPATSPGKEKSNKMSEKSAKKEKAQNKDKEVEVLDLEEHQPPIPRTKGAIQIADGLFVGDQQSSRDAQFIRGNQIVKIINTCNSRITNIFDQSESENEPVQAFIKKKGLSFQKLFGQIKYLNYDWQDNVVPEGFESEKLRQEIFDFVDSALRVYRSVLIISETNQQRSIMASQLFMMMKFNWNVQKTLEYLFAKK